eukprot:4848455-Alexandrium_andersonii.AAC.1
MSGKLGIEWGLMTTVHDVASSQPMVDGSSNKGWGGGRADHGSITTSAGAAKTVALARSARNTQTQCFG